ncbi:MAG: tetratricopeptide repeat protein [Granulosicoccus sp.]
MRENRAFRKNFDRAKEFHRTGNRIAAKALYQNLMKAHSSHPDLLHFYGLFCFQEGNSNQGIRFVKRCLEVTPDYPDAINNLANMFKMQGLIEDAERMYRDVIQLHPGFYDAMVNLGAIERSKQNYKEAEHWYRQAIATKPDDALAYDNLTRLLTKLGRADEALGTLQESVQKTVRNDQQLEAMYALKARAAHVKKDSESVIAVYEEWVGAFPASQYARHMLAAANGQDIPAKSHPEYVRDLFDQFADSFDEVLDSLDYQAPALVGDKVEALYSSTVAAADTHLMVLDAGCGTGLCGEHLRPYSRHLTGVDISPGMLSRARSTQRYDELVESDIVAYLASNPEKFDLMVSADTLNYFGDLQGLFDMASASLTAGAHMIFTLEMHETNSHKDFHLNIHGRYSHSKDYIDRVLRQAGLTLVVIEDVIMRKEHGKPVHGVVVTAQRQTEISF